MILYMFMYIMEFIHSYFLQIDKYILVVHFNVYVPIHFGSFINEL